MKGCKLKGTNQMHKHSTQSQNTQIRGNSRGIYLKMLPHLTFCNSEMNFLRRDKNYGVQAYETAQVRVLSLMNYLKPSHTNISDACLLKARILK